MALACNSMWQIKDDTWCSLEEASAQPVLAGAQHRPVDELDKAIRQGRK
jgi:hypothetical protein